jgi:uncharacterized protein YpmB
MHIKDSVKIAKVFEVPLEEVFYLDKDTRKDYNYNEFKFPTEFYLDF